MKWQNICSLDIFIRNTKSSIIVKNIISLSKKELLDVVWNYTER